MCYTCNQYEKNLKTFTTYDNKIDSLYDGRSKKEIPPWEIRSFLNAEFGRHFIPVRMVYIKE